MFLGVDIGTSSSKAVLVDEHGTLVASATRPHGLSSPRRGWFEHDAEQTWWDAFSSLTHEVLDAAPGADVHAVCTSGIGPCVLVADDSGRPLRAAILYGIDARAEREIDDLTQTLGAEEVVGRTGNRLTTQAVGPKLAWISRNEPAVWERATRWYCASNWLVQRLTGEYVVDHYSASGSDPLYDLTALDWWDDGWRASAAAQLERPRLVWPGDVVGEVTAAAAAATGLRAGTPVVAGTVDALAEAYSAGCEKVGDTMVMYASTLFMIQTLARPAVSTALWALSGRTRDTYSLAAGMSTSGLLVDWLAIVVGEPLAELVVQARGVAPGSDGLLLLPYLAGERTPILDPHARGTWVGLTLRHGRAHLFRSALEAIALGIRHNLEAMHDAGATPARLVAVGGGTRGGLLAQIASDATGLPQDLPTHTVGASFGDARMAADACAVDTSGWNPVATRYEPDRQAAAVYDELYGIYTRTYAVLRDEMHALGVLGRDRAGQLASGG